MGSTEFDRLLFFFSDLELHWAHKELLLLFFRNRVQPSFPLDFDCVVVFIFQVRVWPWFPATYQVADLVSWVFAWVWVPMLFRRIASLISRIVALMCLAR